MANNRINRPPSTPQDDALKLPTVRVEAWRDSSLSEEVRLEAFKQHIDNRLTVLRETHERASPEEQRQIEKDPKVQELLEQAEWFQSITPTEFCEHLDRSGPERGAMETFARNNNIPYDVVDGRVRRDSSGCVVEAHLHGLPITSLKGLDGLRKLKVLDLSSNPIDGLKLSEGFPTESLEALFLKNNSMGDTTALSKARKLKVLLLGETSFKDKTLPKDIPCHSLEILSVHGCFFKGDLSAISEAKNLKLLRIDDNHFESLNGIPTDSLEELYAENCGHPSSMLDLKALSPARSLKRLMIAGSPVESVESIPMESLEELDARGCHITGDLSWLSRARSLKTLNISDNKVTSLQGAPESLEALVAYNCSLRVWAKHLDPSGNVWPTDLGISNLHSLKYLDISNCLNVFTLHGVPMQSLEFMIAGGCSLTGDHTFLSDAPQLRLLEYSTYYAQGYRHSRGMLYEDGKWKCDTSKFHTDVEVRDQIHGFEERYTFGENRLADFLRSSQQRLPLYKALPLLIRDVLRDPISSS